MTAGARANARRRFAVATSCQLVSFREERTSRLLVATTYESKSRRPQVVVWLAHQAQKEYFRWEEAIVTNDEEKVRYGDFTIPVAADFDAFLLLLRESP